METIFALICVAFLAPAAWAQYTPDWDSLDSRPLPAWYDEAKIGIFMHFGPYAVPGVESEWFWMQSVRNESEGDYRCLKYLEDYYPPKFTYQDFGSMLTMDFFESDRIADIVAMSGAKYFVFTSKHHDGFANWDSTYAYGWNSQALGPDRDVVSELKESFQSRHPDIHFGLYYSLYEWFNPIYLKDKANDKTTREYPTHKMLPEMQELVMRFSPDILWSDGDWEAPPEYWGSQEFLAWLYNDSPSKDTVVVNDRWGVGTQMTHGDFYSGPDRYDPGTLQEHKWENALTIDRQSWGYRRDISIADIMGMDELIKKIVSAVSCGGNILVNVGPTKEGTISPIFQERLLQMGSWLKVNGEAIYSTVPWSHQNDSYSGDVWYTSKGSVVYATVLGWPEGDAIELADPVVTEGETVVTMLGLQGELQYSASESTGRVTVSFPSMSGLARGCGRACDWGYVIKFEGLANAPESSPGEGGGEEENFGEDVDIKIN